MAVVHFDMEVNMMHWINQLLAWIERAETRRLEDYLAGSGNVTELEQRMREWEWRGVK
jgi:hypothetical protein